MFQDYVIVDNYALGISPGITARKTARAIFTELENNTQFSIYLQNLGPYRAVAVVQVDSVESGRFAMEP